QLTLNIINFYGFAQRPQFPHNVANLFNHQVGSKVRMDRFDLVHLGNATTNSTQNPLGGTHERTGPAAASFLQLQLFIVEGRVNFFPLFCELQDKVVEFGETTFQFFQLDHDLGHVVVTAFRSSANFQIVDDRLSQQLQLRMKFGSAFDA